MDKVMNVYKPVGLSPLQLINEIKKVHPELNGKTVSYAGRLDPMAHGVMLLTAGEAIKEKDKYLNLNKTYAFEVFFGAKTDTYDVMGLVKNENFAENWPDDFEGRIKSFMKKKIGISEQYYPPYSSKTVMGKPLHWWSRQNRLNEIDLPKRRIEIYDFEFLSFGEMQKTDFKKIIIERVGLVSGDFRQEEIIKTWTEFLEDTKIKNFKTARFKINCSSGTYIRGIANEMGEALQTGAIAIDILRTRVGDFGLEKSILLRGLDKDYRM